MSFINRIVDRMKIENFQIFDKPKERNIVYLEGCNPEGTPNKDEPNHFNDLRMVFEFNDYGDAEILGGWQATTEPGYYYTDNPMNRKGAARIAFGQYKAWQVGIHGYSEPHESLIQVDNVRVHRDYNRDMIRTGDLIEPGLFGINQHHGFDHPVNDIYTASAGCLVGRTRHEHKTFMTIIKQDPRYKANPDFVFSTTILDGSKISS